MTNHVCKGLRIGLLASMAGLPAATCEADNVDTQLVILVDAQTYSQSDFNLILDSVAKSFEKTDFQTAVMQGMYGKMASSVMLYNLPGQQVALNWTELTTQQDFLNFASSVRSIAYPNTGGNVSYASAISAAAAHISSSSSQGTTQQITLIDDATGFWQVDPTGTKAARDAAIASGVDIINAIVFDAAYQESAVNSYYATNIVSPNSSVTVLSTPQGGPKSAADLGLVSDSISGSVTGPAIAAVPEPAAAGLALLGSLLGITRRRRKD